MSFDWIAIFVADFKTSVNTDRTFGESCIEVVKMVMVVFILFVIMMKLMMKNHKNNNDGKKNCTVT